MSAVDLNVQAERDILRACQEGDIPTLARLVDQKAFLDSEFHTVGHAIAFCVGQIVSTVPHQNFLKVLPWALNRSFAPTIAQELDKRYLGVRQGIECSHATQEAIVANFLQTGAPERTVSWPTGHDQLEEYQRLSAKTVPFLQACQNAQV